MSPPTSRKLPPLHALIRAHLDELNSPAETVNYLSHALNLTVPRIRRSVLSAGSGLTLDLGANLRRYGITAVPRRGPHPPHPLPTETRTTPPISYATYVIRSPDTGQTQL